MASHRKMAKSAVIVSFGIMTSRILGFVRDVLIANFFGTKIFAQVFVMAFTVPNVLRQLVAEGAVNTVFVPVMTEYRLKKSKEEFLRFANVLLNIFLAILLILVAAGIFLTPLIIRIIAPGFMADPRKFYLTVILARILFPYILLVGLTAYCAGVLNTYKHFAAPAFATTVWNATIIGYILIFYRSFDIVQLTVAVLIGGVLQLALQLFPLFKRGSFFDIRAGFFHEGAKRVGRLLLPRTLGAGIYQINIIVDRMLASLQYIVGSGAVAALYYGNRLFQLPLALFSISIATAALPTMSSLAAENNIDKLKEAVTFSLRNMLFLSVPASIGLMALSGQIIRVIFERGEFTPYSTDLTSFVLFFYAMGLAAYGGVRILISAFYAMQDTRTPVKIAAVALVVNIVMNVVLMFPLKVGGLALATSISGFVNFALLFVMLRRKIGPLDGGEIVYLLPRILSASLIMGTVAYLMRIVLPWNGGLRDGLNLLLIIFCAVVTYIAACLILKVKEVGAILSWIKKN